MPSPGSNESETPSGMRRALTVSPDVVLKAKASVLWGGLVTIVGCAITCTAYVVRMEGKIDQGLATSQEINAKLEEIGPEHAILWDWYNRTASRGHEKAVGP